MPSPQKAKVFMTGRSQAVRIPIDFRFQTSEVYIRRDIQTGDIVLSQTAARGTTWDDFFTELDAAYRAGEIPEDFMLDRNQGPPQRRDDL